MKFSSSSIINKDDHNGRLLKQQEKKLIFNRFLSFNEKTLILLENCHYSLNDSTLNLIEEDKDNNLNNKTFSYECNQCLKIYASEYGYNYHINMYHSNQSILCSDCNITFRSHRALKTHQQRFHLNYYSQNLPNYNYISSYLIVAFSTKQFSLITKNACEQGRLPLGELSSKLYPCELCHISFSCSNALKYHLLNKHEQYEYKICKNILYDIVIQVEYDLKTVNDDDDDIESMKYLLSKQASNLGLVDKQLEKEIRCIKHENNHLIYPTCQHQNRTCANLCLKYLSSYNKLIDNYSYKIPTIPKTNPFIHGSIVSKPLNGSLINNSITTTKDELNSNQKRTSLKRVKSSISDYSLSPSTKRKFIEQQFKINETKSSSIEQSSTSPKKIVSKTSHSYTRSLSSMSSNSFTSTRTSSKTSRHQTITSLKRSISPTITLAVERSSEKRRRQREQRKAKAVLSSSSSSDMILKIDDDIEQENGDDDTDDITSIKCKKPKKTRQASNSSVEYVQIINNDQQSISSLNNIENIKLKTNTNDKDIIICQSPPSVKNLSKTSVNNQHVPDYDEHIRVRCKICDDILEGRSRFSKHVLTMHSHLLKNKMSDIKQQQQTTIVR